MCKDACKDGPRISRICTLSMWGNLWKSRKVLEFPANGASRGPPFNPRVVGSIPTRSLATLVRRPDGGVEFEAALAGALHRARPGSVSSLVRPVALLAQSLTEECSAPTC